MAKRIINWTLAGDVLNLSKYNSDKEAPIDILASFDMTKLPEEMMKQVQAYGLKQKLADSGASAIGDIDEKVNLATKKFDELLENKWTGDRVNATGGAENKRILSSAKTLSKVVSLEGLMMKQMAYPDLFTEEEQKKLDEFMAIKVKSMKKK